MRRLTLSIMLIAPVHLALGKTCDRRHLGLEELCPRDYSAIFIFSPQEGDATYRNFDLQEESCKGACLPPGMAPPDPRIQCVLDRRELLCEAWPRGTALSYIWSQDRRPNEAFPAPLPYQSFACGSYFGPVVVRVQINTSTGGTAAASLQTTCGLQATTFPPVVGDPIAPTRPGLPSPGSPPSESK